MSGEKRVHEPGAGVGLSNGAEKKLHGLAPGTREAFLDVYQQLLSEIVDTVIPSYGLPAEAKDWNRELIEYNVPGGKLNRGLSVVHTLQAIRGEHITADEVHKASVLGWAIEWLQAFFLVADDVMDSSITRRGQPCWYKLPKVGLTAINDAFLLQAQLYRLLKNHFAGLPYYLEVLELFNEVTWQTELGQLLDLTSQPAPGVGPIDLERFTMERYQAIVKHKTAFYSFYLPIAAGLVVAGLASEQTLKEARDILLLMGEYFQIQDDYLDAYADEATLGKVGTDIQDNKCSWLVVQALQLASPEQKAYLKAHYGKHDEEDVKGVKQLYRDLKLEEVYLAYEDAVYAKLNVLIDATFRANPAVPKTVYTSLLDKIYKRKK